MSIDKVLMPLPEKDFDPTEAAISWQVVTDAGYEVIFATESGSQSSADPMMLSGEGLDFWGFIPVLKKLTLVGRVLRANKTARAAYSAMQQSAAFLNPIRFSQLAVDDFVGLVLPGGHKSEGMCPYLENSVLQQFIVDYFQHELGDGKHKPVAAVCHGVLVLARSISQDTGRSVLYGRKTTALTWQQEQAAQRLNRVIRFWDPLYYRTYSENADEALGYWSVESEVKRALAKDEDFITVPENADDYRLKTANIARDTVEDARPAWVVQDENYISARWPGDMHSLALGFVGLLNQNK